MIRSILSAALASAVCAGEVSALGPPAADASSCGPSAGSRTVAEQATTPGGPLSQCPPDESRYWVGAEYLLWWYKDSPLPVTLLAVPAQAGMAPPALFGNQPVDAREHNGARLTLGGSLGGDGMIAGEGEFFFQESKTTARRFATGGPAGMPFVDAVGIGIPAIAGDAMIGAFPPIAAALSLSDRLWGAEANALARLPACRCGPRVTLLGGARCLELKEDLALQLPLLSVMTPEGNFTTVPHDQFNTRNQFYGGQVGARADWCFGELVVTAAGKIALGDMHESVDVSGAGTVTTNGVTAAVPVGFFAQPSNIGHHSRDEFAEIPEATLALSYRLACRARAYVGYEFLYVSNTVRPGEQIDPRINLTQVPTFPVAPAGPAVPIVPFADRAFWAQGLNFGMELRF